MKLSESAVFLGPTWPISKFMTSLGHCCSNDQEERFLNHKDQFLTTCISETDMYKSMADLPSSSFTSEVQSRKNLFPIDVYCPPNSIVSTASVQCLLVVIVKLVSSKISIDMPKSPSHVGFAHDLSSSSTQSFNLYIC